ncbi:hypothetical protein BV20DRAFT_723536 [Pilatotrama ljubarskyi]|nr:hypothetical protein BV20DRAFT_723536 [Pilatotrama ljubarskyi]
MTRLAILRTQPAPAFYPSVARQLRFARRYSDSPPSKPSSSSTRSAAPYVAGALAGVGAIGLAGYAWYHFSGAKRAVDAARRTKEIYEEKKAAVIEKRDAGREKAAAVADATKEKTSRLAERWKLRSGFRTAEEKQADAPEGTQVTGGKDAAA